MVWYKSCDAAELPSSGTVDAPDHFVKTWSQTSPDLVGRSYHTIYAPIAPVMFKLGAISCAFQHVITVVNFESHNVQAITPCSMQRVLGD